MNEIIFHLAKGKEKEKKQTKKSYNIESIILKISLLLPSANACTQPSNKEQLLLPLAGFFGCNVMSLLTALQGDIRMIQTKNSARGDF